jgi:hypothetical protein
MRPGSLSVIPSAVRLLLPAAIVASLVLAGGCGGSSGEQQRRDTGAPTDTGAADAGDGGDGGDGGGGGEDARPPECRGDADCGGAFGDLGGCERAVCEGGRCLRDAAPDYVACDDGNACSVVSFCRDGVCTAGLALDCDDRDPCTRDGCYPEGGCFHTALDGVSCDDGDPCTRSDRCSAGVCGGTFDLACVCATDADCAEREDGDLCNGVLRCVAERCVRDPDTIVRCDRTGDARCLPTTCDPATGTCAPSPATDGAACEDGNLCTQGDTCQGGVCAPGAYACAPCDGDGACAPFDDGDDCNGTLVCAAAACATEATTVVTCRGAEPCVAAYCDPATGGCATADRLDGSWCDDGDACTGRSTCAAGACVGAPKDCDDGNACTTDGCDAAGACTHEAVAGCVPCDPLADCDDGDDCTADVCEGGVCRHAEVPGCRCVDAASCDDADPCTADVCDPQTGRCANPPAGDGTTCGAAEDRCHEVRQCQQGVCLPGAAIVCDDGVDCTEDTCDPAAGCQHRPTAACACTTAAECDDGDPCTADACGADQRCVYAPAGAGVPCDDGSACTTGDSCDAAGHCQPGAAVACTDDDPCTAERCDPASGCVYPDAPDGTGCDDGDPCTGPDTCEAGVCVAGRLLCERDCSNRLDDDRDGDTDCDDADCAAHPACARETDCRDGVDNDGDGATDCGDSDCNGRPCGPPESVCDDALDNDRDGDTDCGDADCAADPSCNPEGECRNGIDDDRDGDTDCDDPDCAADPSCNPEGDCRNGIDDDRDGATDCADPDCAADPYCLPETDCTDGVDDDLDGDTDCADPDCADHPACVDVCLDALPIACGDLVDGTNVGVESLIDDWGCGLNDALRWPGGEVVYAFTPATAVASATARLIDLSADHDLFVLGPGCDVQTCLATGVVSVTFAANAGETVYLVVDGYSSAPSGAFGLSLECGTGPTTETDCDDGVDDDHDGATDCADDDCVDAEACQASCTSAASIACEGTRAGTTAGGPARIDVYRGACEAIDAGGPERAYAFRPATSERVRARVRPAAGLDLDLRVLQGECLPSACVHEGTRVGADTITWDAVGGTTYYLAVDGGTGSAGAFDLDVTCGCTDDPYEAADSEFTPVPLETGTYPDLRLCPADFTGDWFSVALCEGALVTVDVAYLLAEGNIDLELIGPGLLGVVADDIASDPAARVTYTALVDGAYKIHVYLNGVDGGFYFGNSYNLTIAVDTSGCSVGPRLCGGPQALSCGQTRTGDNRGLVSAIDGYGCAAWSEPGGEVVYAFTAARAVPGARVAVTPTMAGFDPDVFVLGGSCDPAFCVTHGAEAATWNAISGATYYVIVDGFQSGPAGTFEVTLTCPPPVEVCDNGSDDDGDLAIDCDDPDCVDAPACVRTCLAGFTLGCGADDTWTTVAAGGPLSAIDRYLCATKDASGSDYAYAFTPAADGQVTVTLLTNTPGVDLDLYVLAGACAADRCVAYGTTDDDAGELVTFDAQGGTTYYLAVDGAAGEEGVYDILVECGGAPGLCGGAVPIHCGAVVVGDNTGRTSRQAAYTCGLTQETGGEVVYEFTPTEDLLDVHAAIVADSSDHDIYVLTAACDPTVCEYGDVVTPLFDAVAGETLYIVVEGYQLSEGSFSLELSCPTATEDCSDGVDNNGDAAVDCADVDCAGDPACVTCEPYPGECGLVDVWTTAFSADALHGHACAPGRDASGPDFQYEFTLDRTQRISLRLEPDPPTAALDLYVLAAACDASACIAASTTDGVETLDFVAAAGVTYYVVVDGPAGAGADYTLSATCGSASAALCAAPTNIYCGDQLSGDTTGVPNQVTTYGCQPWTESGGERVYRFAPTRDWADVSATLLADGADHDVFVLDSFCDAAAGCLASGDGGATFDARGGATYYIVVDGAAANPAGTYTLGLTCPAGPDDETDCGDGLDEDGDGLTDCEDTGGVCQTSAACNGSCAAPTPLTCDQTVLGDTSGRPGALNGYPCADPFGAAETGAETVYVFTPTEDVTAQMTIISSPVWNTELLVLRDGCAPTSCVAWFDAAGAWTFQAGHTYYIVVDGRNGANGPYLLSFECL